MLETNQGHPLGGYHITVGPKGRIIVPAPVRELLNIRTGDTLIVHPHVGGLELRTYEQAVNAAQDRFCAAAPVERRLSDELIDERRHEAAAE